MIPEISEISMDCGMEWQNSGSDSSSEHYDVKAEFRKFFGERDLEKKKVYTTVAGFGITLISVSVIVGMIGITMWYTVNIRALFVIGITMSIIGTAGYIYAIVLLFVLISVV